ncbi:unnamed protein product [Brachionus calyciflorus]|uniref:Hexosyltransferase n=1 Tax=Brachionus calyciflorus TaxID=104777 RepID=A0A814BD55_9BILA|nr:unnamed protein product [Brachionus calyciflorus]
MAKGKAKFFESKNQKVKSKYENEKSSEDEEDNDQLEYDESDSNEESDSNDFENNSEEEGEEMESDEDNEEEEEGSEDDDNDQESNSDQEDEEDAPKSSREDGFRDAIRSELNSMTFEQIQQLQNKLGLKKFKEVMQDKPDNTKDQSSSSSNPKTFKRLNKNRPQELSSKKPVPVLRNVFQAKKKEFIDPRFNPALGEYKPEVFRKRFGFINEMRENERKMLQEELKKEEDPVRRDQIKAALTRLKQQITSFKASEKKEEFKAKLKKVANEDAKEGKRPHFVNKSEQKILELAEKYKELKKNGKIEKFLAKKRKKQLSKDRLILTTSIFIHVNLIKIFNEKKLNKLEAHKIFEIQKDSLLDGLVIPENEGDIYSYSAFTLDKFYPSELGIYKRNVFKLTGLRKHEIHTVLNESLAYLNRDSMFTKNFKLSDFIIGFMRTDPLDGYQYELFFKNENNSCEIVRLRRPLGHLKIESFDNFGEQNERENINFIVPISSSQENLNKLKQFLIRFYEIAIKQDSKDNTLTIPLAYQNESDLSKFQNYLNLFVKIYNYSQIKLIPYKMSEFSRSALLNYGTQSRNSNDLLFFCDLDIVFNQNFLEMCRHNTIRTKRVFFPILYSYYNPRILEMFQNEKLNENKSGLIIDKYSGYFRDTGFGMVCLYKQDYDLVGGFKGWESKEWGGEDLYLYRKFLKSKMKIFRSITPGLFHLYHPKICNPKILDKVQYKNCLNVKIMNEASYESFGNFFFNFTNSK